MNRLRAVVLALTVASPLSAQSAEITRIASSFEDNHPFGMFVDVGFENTSRRMLISHELHTDAGLVDHPELRYSGIDTRLNLDLHIGIWKDVEFQYGLPIVFQHNDYYGFAAGTNATNSTLTASPVNCIGANGVLYPGCPASGANAVPYASFPASGSAPLALRGGLGNMRFGLAWAPFNQLKDDTKPTWIVGIDYEAPTAKLLDPSVVTTPDSRGNIGDRTHKYSFYTTFSRRIGAIDPYFQARWTVTYHGPGWYSNCDNPSASNMAIPANCSMPQWTRDETGIQVPQTLGLVFGSEFAAYEESAKHQRVGLDLRAIADYIGPGRYYNELSALTGKLMFTQDYLKFGGSLGLNAYASDYIRLQAVASLLYNTPHLLSAEPIGKDINGDGVVNVSSNPKEVNPNFDYRMDVASRHFIASEITEFRIDIVASLNF